jgi:hypothetical protein
VKPVEGLRSVGNRLVPSAEALAQAVADRVVELVVSALDMNALLERVDLNAVLDQIDINGLLDQVDVNELLKKVDLDAISDRLDVNAIAQRIDVDALVKQTDLAAVIAKSSGGVGANALDIVRSQAVGLDEFIARWVARLRRRTYTGPPPPAGRFRDAEG